jgi:hypothetical protein
MRIEGFSVFLCALCASVVTFYHGGTEGTKVHGDFLNGALKAR